MKEPVIPENRRDGRPPNILALDTASAALSAALSAGERTWYFEADAGLRHSELLMEIVDTLFGKAGMDRGDLDAVACMKGPGSFTGLRIGFAAAKGIALALGIPLVTAPTLDCMAASLSVWPGIVLPAIDAKKNSFFAALYSGGLRLCPDMDAEAPLIARTLNRTVRERPPCPVILTGPDAGLLASRLGPLFPEGAAEPELCIDPLGRRGRAGELLKLAKDTFLLNNGLDDVFSGPEYIRPSDAELKSGLNSKT
ncbi:MAG: tRNA (adenosine(37)-N6)-threonylcarbamoyltransferase complex dimerization subunit type 1 TsaB [Treponema sp.]|nr:tRNA (adenosine(37)-N6)-threonylcarbamoyltransferase complex dimerization subunit type 1 TsaB [Treponema sp.]